MPYRIEYAHEAGHHLEELGARDRSIALDGIERHLRDQPVSEARNRKRMREDSIASWELRLGRLRVYYDVENDVVSVVAIGLKLRERVLIGGKVIDP